MSELLQYNLQSVRSRLMREDFQRFWEYGYPTCAAKFLDEWCTRTMRSKIGPRKKVAKTLRRHRELILNWFRAEGVISAGIVEGLNNKAKLTMRKAYGFRTAKAITVALYYQLGDLPEPDFTHRFCSGGISISDGRRCSAIMPPIRTSPARNPAFRRRPGPSTRGGCGLCATTCNFAMNLTPALPVLAVRRDRFACRAPPQASLSAEGLLLCGSGRARASWPRHDPGRGWRWP
jgi:hypothetical protein